MKQFSILLGAAVLGALSFSSCKKDFNVQNGVQEGLKCELTVSASAVSGTKATDASKDDTVKDIQVFVFRGGVLEAYKKAEASTLSVECTSGSREVYVVANGPVLSDKTTPDALKAAVVDLATNAPDKLTMVGNRTVTLPDDGPVTVDVSRLVARVVLKQIVRECDAALASTGFKIKQIYLSKATKSVNLGRTAPSGYYNNGTTGDVPAMLSESMDVEIANNASHAVPHYFYTMPTSDKVCSLIVQAEMAGKLVYYTIPLPAMTGNNSYEIASLKIKHFGTDNPGEEVKPSAIEFAVNVLDWHVVPIEEQLM